MIKPTVGRQVWLRLKGRLSDNGQPFAATVVYVHSDRLINVAYYDHIGQPERLTSVPLLQDEDERPEGAFCEWMPYQRGVASGALAPNLHASVAVEKAQG